MRTEVREPEAPISLKQAALEFGVSQSTIWKYIRKGRLSSWRRPMDRQTWVDRKEMTDLLTWVPAGGRR